MTKKLILQALVVFAFSCAMTTSAHHGTKLVVNENRDSNNNWVDLTMSKMTLDEKIAQLMVASVIPNDNVDNKAYIKSVVATHNVGGIIFFEGEAASYASLINYAQSLSRVPLMVAVDGEWGLAMRVKDATKFPKNLQLSSIADDDVFYQYGQTVARECRALGIHVNFAPVLDVIDRQGSSVANRSLGYDPELVSRHAIAYARGLEDGGVIAVGKHFPGHGSTTADSHKTLPVIEKDLQALERSDLVPFRRFINAGLSGILVAHLNIPSLDPSPGPSTMSKPIVTGLLKEKMGFKGLIFTDALGMQGAKQVAGSPSVAALLAGNDVLLMPENVEQEIAAVHQAVDDGILSESLIDERCKKILTYKYNFGLSKKPAQVDIKAANSILSNDAATVLARQMVEKSVTVITDANNLLPVRGLGKRKIALVTTDAVQCARFIERCRSYADVTVTAPMNLKANDYDVVIFAARNAADAQVAQSLMKSCHNPVLALMMPTDALPDCADIITDHSAKTAIWVPQNDDVSQDYLAQAIFGGCDVSGILPVRIESKLHNKTLKVGQGKNYQAIRLGYTIPAEVGFDSQLQHKIDSVCAYGISQRAFPGCQVVVVRHGKVVVDSSYGEINFGSGIKVTDETLFGLASVSKATGTISAVMKTYDDGKFKLDEPASKYIPGLRIGGKSNITFRDLLYHETGMKPSLNMWDMMMDKSTYTGKLISNEPTAVNTIKVMKGAYGNKNAKLRTDILSPVKTERFNIAIADGIYGGKVTYDSVMARIYASPLNSTRKYVYSCLNFSLLADAMQRMNHQWLDIFVDNNVFRPLGAYHTCYRPLEHFSPNSIAYTEDDTFLRRQHIHGYVHDELAAFSGGVQGNAGLFSNANDLAKLFQMWLNGGVYGGERFLKKSTVDLFLNSKSPNSHRGLGFDKPVIGDPEASNTCSEATPSVIGHTGFTGTCYWIDPENDMIYIFLSNRVCPTRDNPAFSRVSARSHINTILYKSIKTK